MKKIFLADSSEQMNVRDISVSWAQKRLIPSFKTWCTSCSWKNFFSPIRAMWWVLDSFRLPKFKNVWFLLSKLMYVEFMRKFFQADSSELMGVRLISASWAQKRLIPTLQTSCTSNSWKMFFSPIRANWWVRLIFASWAQKRLIPTL